MSTAKDALQGLFTALEERNHAAAMDCFTDDAVLFDPHYPTPKMEGRAAIAKGLTWGLKSMKQFGFTIEKTYQGENGTSCAVEIDTHHFLSGGQELRFPQAFFVETTDGKISAFRAYEPYGPNGFMGFMLRLSHKFAK
ncbi:nuclear transport factor 2 family protein [uncultured Sulfitobacter sp.]|uniref:nuclear transport factor 2 family protein n=1 Tax=uncultured Sulfitobacter sp. TaxID=191468 RepID=UPI002602B66D|nr:nuclear transport factor 2 family protein [uncultured Sulfitobacter sp.]